MKKVLICISFVLLFGCMPKIPEMKTMKGDECIVKCQGTYIYNGSLGELKDCYQKCVDEENK